MDSLSEQQSAYVEEMGTFYERYGSQRSLGRVIGLMLISEKPLSQDDLMRLLNLSRSATSTALHLAVTHIGMVMQVGVPGDRKRYYQIRPDVGEWLTQNSMEKIDMVHKLFSKAEVLAEPGARHRLTTFCKTFTTFHELFDKIWGKELS